MKKFVLVSIIISLIGVSTKAQVLSTGIKAGGDLAYMITDYDVLESSPISGFHGGVFFRLRSRGLVGLKTEVLYATRGSNFDIANSPANDKIEVRLSYIDLPLFLTFKANETVSFELGPQVSILVDGETKFITPNGEVITEYNPENDPEIGLAGSIDLDLPGQLGIYARANFGLSNTATILTSTSLNNVWLQIGLKYRIFEAM